MPVRSLRDGTIRIADAGGVGGANVITVALEDGGLNWTEDRSVDIISDRGVLDHARQAPEVPVSGTLSLLFESFLVSAAITPYEAIRMTSGASAWVSDASSGGDGTAFIMELVINDPAGGSDETILFSEVYAEQIDFAEGFPSNSLSFNFRAVQVAPAIS
jgi:hypothetical protein